MSIDKIFPKKSGEAATSTRIGIPRVAIGVMLGLLLALGACDLLRKSGVDIYLPVKGAVDKQTSKAIQDANEEQLLQELNSETNSP